LEYYKQFQKEETEENYDKKIELEAMKKFEKIKKDQEDRLQTIKD
jgi:hypothetical protein